MFSIEHQSAEYSEIDSALQWAVQMGRDVYTNRAKAKTKRQINDNHDHNRHCKRALVLLCLGDKRENFVSYNVFSHSQELFKLNNFNTCLSITAGLSNAAVHRLKFTRAEVPERLWMVSSPVDLLLLSSFQVLMLCTNYV